MRSGKLKYIVTTGMIYGKILEDIFGTGTFQYTKCTGYKVWRRMATYLQTTDYAFS